METQEGVFSVETPANITLHNTSEQAGGIDMAEMEKDMGLQDKADKLEERKRRKEAKIVRIGIIYLGSAPAKDPARPTKRKNIAPDSIKYVHILGDDHKKIERWFYLRTII